MTLIQLSSEYRKSGELCRQRQEELSRKLECEELCEMDRLRLRRRIYILGVMARDSIATSRYLENYYGDDGNAGKEAEYVC